MKIFMGIVYIIGAVLCGLAVWYFYLDNKPLNLLYTLAISGWLLAIVCYSLRLIRDGKLCKGCPLITVCLDGSCLLVIVAKYLNKKEEERKE